VRRSYANFTYQAGSWTKPRRVIAKVEWHPGELYPRVGFIVTNMSRPAENVVAFYNKRGTCEQWIKEGKGAIRWTRLSCRSFAANAVRASCARRADEPQREADQDRREGREPWPLCRVPDGRGRDSEKSVLRHTASHRGTAAAPTHVSGVMRTVVMRTIETDGRHAS
jgi:Transposase DDE domain group 1